MKAIYLALPVVCLSALAAVSPAFAYPIQHRELRQEERIDQGITQDQLSPTEQRNLQQDEVRVDNQEMHDLHQNDGRLTPFEAAQLNHRLSNLSWDIYRDRHF